MGFRAIAALIAGVVFSFSVSAQENRSSNARKIAELEEEVARLEDRLERLQKESELRKRSPSNSSDQPSAPLLAPPLYRLRAGVPSLTTELITELLEEITAGIKQNPCPVWTTKDRSKTPQNERYAFTFDLPNDGNRLVGEITYERGQLGVPVRWRNGRVPPNLAIPIYYAWDPEIERAIDPETLKEYKEDLERAIEILILHQPDWDTLFSFSPTRDRTLINNSNFLLFLTSERGFERAFPGLLKTLEARSAMGNTTTIGDFRMINGRRKYSHQVTVSLMLDIIGSYGEGIGLAHADNLTPRTRRVLNLLSTMSHELLGVEALEFTLEGSRGRDRKLSRCLGEIVAYERQFRFLLHLVRIEDQKLMTLFPDDRPAIVREYISIISRDKLREIDHWYSRLPTSTLSRISRPPIFTRSRCP